MAKMRHRTIVVVLSVIICVAITCFYFMSYDQVGEIYHSEIGKTIVDIKKSFLKNTVDNMIYDIEITRESQIEFYTKIINGRYDALKDESHLSDSEFTDYFIQRFAFSSDKDIGLTAFLWDSATNTISYDPLGSFQGDFESTQNFLQAELAYYQVIEHGNLSGLIGVSQKYIDDQVKVMIADKIRDLHFDNDSYIWVNGVLDYEGGANYAVRIVHPNLIETEGMYLSTEMTDVQGNLPYLEELEGVREHGEIFFTYYFQRMHSDEMAEKITYARLYEDFDWIIAMGVHLEDVKAYIDQTDQKSRELANYLTFRLLLVLLSIVLFALFLLVCGERKQFHKVKQQMQQEISQDVLTKATSRKTGTEELKIAFDKFKRSAVTPVIMMFDLDNLKTINDQYGHYAGDQILKAVVEVVYQVLDPSYTLIRWGGDEFVGILPDLEKEQVQQFGEKICQKVSALEVTIADVTINPTLSIGFSFFQETDQDFLDALHRADQAMYASKAAGRNQINFL